MSLVRHTKVCRTLLYSLFTQVAFSADVRNQVADKIIDIQKGEFYFWVLFSENVTVVARRVIPDKISGIRLNYQEERVPGYLCDISGNESLGSHNPPLKPIRRRHI